MIYSRQIFNALAPHIFVLLFCILFFCQYVYLSHSQVLNHYPFISPDGYEWYTNGLYYLERSWHHRENLPILPVLRPPVYVALNTLDFLIFESGIVLGATQALSIFFTYYFCLILYRQFRANSDKESSIHLWCLALAITLLPINFFRPYILSDSLTVCLSLGSVILLSRFFEDQKYFSLALASMTATLAALTQTYGYIPFFIFLSIYAIGKRSIITYSKFLIYLIALSLPIFTYIIVHYLWRQTLPHLMTPDNFILLSFSLKNWSFYQLIWPLYFWPILTSLAIALLLIKNKRWLFGGPPTLYLVVLIFATLCFFYQWKDSRFTYYFWPWALILFLSILPRLNVVLKSVLLLPFIASIFIFPLNPWHPDAQSIKLSYRSWAYEYFTSKPINRNLNQCIPRCPINSLCEPSCEGNKYFRDFSHHGTGKTLSTYLFLRQQKD